MFCSVDGCGKVNKALGYCSTHYDRWRKYGDVNYTKISSVNNPRYCSIEDCESKHFSLGFCSIHYTRFRKYGDPNFLMRDGNGWIDEMGYRRLWDGGRKTREHRLVMEKKLGRKLRSDEIVHHNDEDRLNNNEDNLELTNRRDHPKYHRKNIRCSLKLCDNGHYAFGYCNMHYQRFKVHGDPLHVRQKRFCSVGKCDRIHYGLGFCQMHYQRFKSNESVQLDKVAI